MPSFFLFPQDGQNGHHQARQFRHFGDAEDDNDEEYAADDDDDLKGQHAEVEPQAEEEQEKQYEMEHAGAVPLKGHPLGPTARDHEPHQAAFDPLTHWDEPQAMPAPLPPAKLTASGACLALL